MTTKGLKTKLARRDMPPPVAECVANPARWPEYIAACDRQAGLWETEKRRLQAQAETAERREEEWRRKHREGLALAANSKAASATKGGTP